jgi:hypothetical protein
MTEPEIAHAMKALCDNLGRHSAIAERAELPKLFRLWGMLIQSQEDHIARLEARTAQLENQLKAIQESLGSSPEVTDS